MREYAFELAVCAALEAESDGIIARQLGTESRIVDVVEISPGPEFEARAEITPETIPGPAIESEIGVGRARRPAAAIDTSPERAEAIAERAVEIGFFEAERRNGRRYVRQATRYPEWIGEIRAIENKPDLGRPGDLERQLRKDVSLALFDEVELVTASYVTGTHLNRIPDAVGVRRFDPETGRSETIREPTRLPSEETGISIVEDHPSRTDIEPVSADRKARLRRRVAERSYGKGWRPETLPSCERAAAKGPPFGREDGLPYCGWKERFVDPASECGPGCPEYAPAEPPESDTNAIRAKRTPWRADPDGVTRRQAGLDAFGEGESGDGG